MEVGMTEVGMTYFWSGARWALVFLRSAYELDKYVQYAQMIKYNNDNLVGDSKI